MDYPKQCQLCDKTEFQFVQSIANLEANCITDDVDLKEVVSHYFSCDYCGTIMQYPQPTLDEMANYFKQSPVVDYQILYKAKEALFQDRLDFFRSHLNLPEGARAMEVGCREGNFLRLLRENLGYDVYGIDPSEEGAAMAREKNQIPMINAAIEHLDLEKEGLAGTFDLVYVMHCMEYVHRPRPFIEQMIRLLKPGGYLYLEVPALGYPYEDLISGRYIHRQQLSHFLGAGLALVLKDLGVTVTTQNVHGGFSYPSIQVFGQKSSYRNLGESLFSVELNHTNARYIEAAERLKVLLSRYPKLTLWGAGFDLHRTLTQVPELLDESRLTVVDVNPKKQGKRMCGLTIQSPEALSNPENLVITASPGSIRRDIRADIQAKFPGVATYELFATEPLVLA